jgi:hypothetical protein
VFTRLRGALATGLCKWPDEVGAMKVTQVRRLLAYWVESPPAHIAARQTRDVIYGYFEIPIPGAAAAAMEAAKSRIPKGAKVVSAEQMRFDQAVLSLQSELGAALTVKRA